MSVYYINKVLYTLETNDEFLTHFRRSAEDALREFRLTSEEAVAIKSGDVASLFRMGAHPFLIHTLARHQLCGLDLDSYLARMRPLGSTKRASSRRSRTNR